MMKSLVPAPLRRAVVKSMRRKLGLFERGQASFSQEGEDLLVAKLLGLARGRRPGFYVDVGAFDPERFSNTLYFYQRGWRGINIDPAPGTLAKFSASRPLDVNLEIAISDTGREQDYFIFNDGALNGCNQKIASLRNGYFGFQILRSLKIPSRRLDAVLDQHLPQGSPIDFLTIDVEGNDLDVLRSNSWDRYRPLLVLAEDFAVASIDDLQSSEVAAYMRGIDYSPVSKCALTLIFADRNRVDRTELGLWVH
jgi:FkbM family methyltransferase